MDPDLAEAVASLSALRSEHADLSITPDDEGLEANQAFMRQMFKAVGSPVPFEDLTTIAGFVADNQLAKLEVAIMRGDVPKQVLHDLVSSAWIDGALTHAAYEEKRRQRALEQAMLDATASDEDEVDDA
jgi:hypothetical protein